MLTPRFLGHLKISRQIRDALAESILIRSLIQTLIALKIVIRALRITPVQGLVRRIQE